MLVISRRAQVRVAVVAAVVLAAGVAAATSASAEDGLCFGAPATITDSEPDPTGEYDNVFTGTDGNDVIIGTGDDDLIDGMGGNDLICGLDADDDLRGGLGNDKIDGGDGNDVITKPTGFATAITGDHLATLDVDGRGGNDVITGPDQGTGFVVGDQYSYAGTTDSGNSGNDRITLGDAQDGKGDPVYSYPPAVVAGDNYNNEDPTAPIGGGNDFIS